MTHIAERPNPNRSAAPVVQRSIPEERQHRKQRLAATFRLFSRLGFDRGVAGHVTVRDPEWSDRFWMNSFGQHFGLIKVSDLHLVDIDGNVIEGARTINQAGFAIHSAIHRVRHDAVAIAHTHSTHGKAWSALGRLLDPLSQDACAFYGDHAVHGPFSGVVLDPEEGRRICETLGEKKALILQNHGLLTIGHTIEAAAWWYISMDNAAQTQLMAEAAGKPIQIDLEIAKQTSALIGRHEGGRRNFEPMYEWMIAKEPDLLD